MTIFSLVDKLKLAKQYNTIVEVDKNYLKIAQAQATGNGMIISKLIAEPVIGLRDEDISKLLLDIVNLNNIRLEDLTVVLSREKAMVRYIRLPSVLPEEINDMVSFEITRQIPYSEDEVVADYEIVDRNSEGYSDIILAIVHKNQTEWINNILKSTGKIADNVRLSSEAITEWLKFATKDRLSQKDICLIDIDTDSSEIAIISGSRLVFSRVASFGAGTSRNTTEAVFSWQMCLIDEIKSSLVIYAKEKGKDTASVSEFIVTGATSVIETFCTTLQQEIAGPCNYLDILPTVPLGETALTEKGISPDISICALCGCLFIEDGINLIPQELRQMERSRKKIKKAILAVISLSLTLTLLFTISAIRLCQKNQLLARMNDILEKVEPEVKATEDKVKRLNFIKEQFQEGATSLDVIYNLYKLIPGNISLIDFDYEEDSRILRFRGTAYMMSDVFRLAAILEGADKFSNVQTRSVVKRRVRENEVVDFQMSCKFITKVAK